MTMVMKALPPSIITMSLLSYIGVIANHHGNNLTSINHGEIANANSFSEMEMDTFEGLFPPNSSPRVTAAKATVSNADLAFLTKVDVFDYDEAYDAMVADNSPTKSVSHKAIKMAAGEHIVIDLHSDNDEFEKGTVQGLPDTNCPLGLFVTLTCPTINPCSFLTVIVPINCLLDPDQPIYTLPRGQNVRVSHGLYATAICVQPLISEYPMGGPIVEASGKTRIGGTVHIFDNALFQPVSTGAVLGMICLCFFAPGTQFLNTKISFWVL